MQRIRARTGKLVLACAAVFGFAAVGTLGTTLGTTFGATTLTGLTPLSSSTPAQVVAARFPSADSRLPSLPASYATASVSVLPTDGWDLFSPKTYYGMVTASPAAGAAADQANEPPSEPVLVPSAAQAPAAPSASAQIVTAKAEPPKSQAATNAAARKIANRQSNVLNDAQIANIKRRLNLTPDQEQMWPAVESALRKIAYAKNATEPPSHVAQTPGARMAYVDPGSAEVQQLKYAALPLIMRLNDDQRREVKMMAHVMGLESVASQF